MATEIRQQPIALPFYYGWVHVFIAALAMVAYGRKHLGKIQGAAQTLTVIASALGPLILAETVSRTGSYASIFYLLTVVVLVLAPLPILRCQFGTSKTFVFLFESPSRYTHA